MAYKKEELIKLAVEAIKKNKLIFIDEIPAFLPCCLATFYNHKLEEIEDIKEELANNRINIKADLRKKWAKQKNATTEIALYKLAASQEERKILSNSGIDLTTGGEKLQQGIDLSKLSDEALKEIINAARKDQQ